MNNTDHDSEFYVGYLHPMAKSIKQFLSQKLLLTLSLLLIIVFCISYFQNNLFSSKFELGNKKELKGILYPNPSPFILHESGTCVMLVGPGKTGAKSLLDEAENIQGLDMYFQRVTVKGTYFYGEGFTFMELTDGLKSILAVGRAEAEPLFRRTLFPKVLYTGEIVDPKCYFGVMSPGDGKVHQSCAVNCIEGGIPAFFVSRTNEYVRNYILQTREGKCIHNGIKKFIGKEVSILGSHSQIGEYHTFIVDSIMVN